MSSFAGDGGRQARWGEGRGGVLAFCIPTSSRWTVDHASPGRRVVVCTGATVDGILSLLFSAKVAWEVFSCPNDRNPRLVWPLMIFLLPPWPSSRNRLISKTSLYRTLFFVLFFATFLELYIIGKRLSLPCCAQGLRVNRSSHAFAQTHLFVAAVVSSSFMFLNRLVRSC